MGPNHDRKPLKDFLMRVFLVFRELVKQEVYPPDWLIIKMVANNIMLKALQELAQPLAFKFLDIRAGYFDKEVCNSNRFDLIVNLILISFPVMDELFQSCCRLFNAAIVTIRTIF